MSETALDLPSERSVVERAKEIGQMTAVEQARAVAEVQAAVVVAQQVPRDMTRAEADMHDTTGRYGLARKAFYSVPNRGEGPTVHLARELARIWGNIQYGVHELRRDDIAGQSEIQAYAWDVQTNARSVRTFIVPHERMRGRSRQKLVDLGDIYLNNQNIGARAVRECIFTVLPAWFTDDAEQRCRATLEAGEEGQSIQDRADEAVAAFARGNVSSAQLEARVGKPLADWTAQDIASLEVLYQSLRRGEITKDETFPPPRVETSDLTDESPGDQPQDTGPTW